MEIYKTEQLHPAADRARHAQLLAAVHNGAMVRSDKRHWHSADFMDKDPWVEPVEPQQPSLQQQIDFINAKLD